MADLVVQTEYFKASAQAWEAISATLSEGFVTALGTPDIPTLWGSAGSLNGVIKQVNDLADTVTIKLLGEGVVVTQSVADTLRQVCRDYVITLAASEDEARRLEGIINDSQ